MLSNFFDLNREVFEQLAASLLEKRVLSRDCLLPLISRVKLPADFPRPLGEFTKFGEKELSL